MSPRTTKDREAGEHVAEHEPAHASTAGDHGVRRPVHKSARKRRKTRRLPPGTAPGTLSVDPEALQSTLHLIAFGDADDAYLECDITDLSELDRVDLPVRWLDVVGLGDARVLGAVAERFDLHPLAVEDVVNVHQRPKMEAYSDHVFVVARMLMLTDVLRAEQVSLFFGRGWVVTFQEQTGDCLEPVRERLRSNRGRIRRAGADYLAYSILDAIVDHIFPVMEAYGDHLEALEDAIFAGTGAPVPRRLLQVRHELLAVRRATWPMRDAVNALMREECDLIEETTRVYLRDCLDHVLRVIDLLENYRELVSSLMDVNLSVVSHKLNEVMKVLTIIATIFIPLGFVAGLYGMNFDPEVSPWNMPELGWRFGYPFALAVMALIAGGLIVYFKRKGWLGGSD